MTPYEILAGPVELYLAPVATAFPKVDATPSGTWVLLGTGGSLNQDEEGVTIEHNASYADWRAAGATGPRKAFRTSESVVIGCKLADLSPTMYAKILNGATVTVTAPGVTQAGESVFPLLQGLTVATFALLARGRSTFGDSFAAQWEIPIVYQNASPKPVLHKGGPALLDCRFNALVDVTNGFGVFRDQSAVHS